MMAMISKYYATRVSDGTIVAVSDGIKELFDLLFRLPSDHRYYLYTVHTDGEESYLGIAE